MPETTSSGVPTTTKADLSATYEPLQLIETVTVGVGGAATIDFSSIPQTFKHLVVEGLVRSENGGSSDALLLQVNGDTGTNYDHHLIRAVGSTVTAVQTRGATSATVATVSTDGTAAGYASPLSLRLPWYTNTDLFKAGVASSWLFRAAAQGDNQVSEYRFGWLSTVAISRLTFLLPSSRELAAGSTLALYGSSG